MQNENLNGVGNAPPMEVLRPRSKSLGSSEELFTLDFPNVEEVLFCTSAIIEAEISAGINMDEKTIFSKTNAEIGTENSICSNIRPCTAEFEVEFHTLGAECNGVAGITDSCGAMADSKSDCSPAVESQDSILEFMQYLQKSINYHPQCNIIAMVYLNRILESGAFQLTGRNWRLIWLSALIVSLKMWDDRIFHNSELATILPGITKDQLKAIEWSFLVASNFDLGMKCSVFAKYYFEFRAMYAEVNPGCHAIKSADSGKAMSVPVPVPVPVKEQVPLPVPMPVLLPVLVQRIAV